MKKHRGANEKNRAIYGKVFVSVAAILIAILVFYPTIQALILSFQTGIGIVTKFGGLTNIKRLFTDQMFITALQNTLLFLIIQVPLMIVLGLVIATLLNNPKLKFKGIYRTAIFLPCVTSLVAYSVLFKSIFAVDGVANAFLLNLHLIQEPIKWLLDPFWAKVTIILAITWRWTGYNMIFYLAALQNVDYSIYEAARIDGCSKWKEFFYITVPMMKPIILLTGIMSTIGTLQLFDEVVNITGGGPGNATLTISQYIYNLSFRFTPNYGYAATVSFVVLIIVAILAYFQFRMIGDKND
ncbi:MAG: carbohydrate ABC transporter permease [Erysipelotrichaceae bacterium]